MRFDIFEFRMWWQNWRFKRCTIVTTVSLKGFQNFELRLAYICRRWFVLFTLYLNHFRIFLSYKCWVNISVVQLNISRCGVASWFPDQVIVFRIEWNSSWNYNISYYRKSCSFYDHNDGRLEFCRQQWILLFICTELYRCSFLSFLTHQNMFNDNFTHSK